MAQNSNNIIGAGAGYCVGSKSLSIDSSLEGTAIPYMTVPNLKCWGNCEFSMECRCIKTSIQDVIDRLENLQYDLENSKIQLIELEKEDSNLTKFIEKNEKTFTKNHREVEGGVTYIYDDESYYDHKLDQLNDQICYLNEDIDNTRSQIAKIENFFDMEKMLKDFNELKLSMKNSWEHDVSFSGDEESDTETAKRIQEQIEKEDKTVVNVTIGAGSSSSVETTLEDITLKKKVDSVQTTYNDLTEPSIPRERVSRYEQQVEEYLYENIPNLHRTFANLGVNGHWRYWEQTVRGTWIWNPEWINN